MDFLDNVMLAFHTLIVAALVGVVLLQRSEGGALGIGGGGGGGGFMSGRGAANLLTRTTTVLAAGFFGMSILLAVTADTGETADDVIEVLTGEGEAPDPAQPDGNSFIDQLGDPLATPEDGETNPAFPTVPSTTPAVDPLALPTTPPVEEVVDDVTDPLAPPADDEEGDDEDGGESPPGN